MSYESPKKKSRKERGNTFTSKDGGFKREKGTAEFVRDYLIENGPTYIQGIYNEFRDWCEDKRYKPPQRDEFRSYFWLLKKLELVKFVKEERNEETQGEFGEDRRFYDINSEKRNHAAWKNPRKHYDNR